MKTPKTIPELDAEFSEVMPKFQAVHDKKQQMVDFYNESAFYPASKRDPAARRGLKWNMLELFADKNVNYVGLAPGIKVAPRMGGSQESDRAHAALLERIVKATHRANEVDSLMDEWGEDGTLMGDCFAQVDFDLQARAVSIRRLDPRFCYYVYADRTRRTLQTFWYAEALTKEEIEARYDVTPRDSGIVITDELHTDNMGHVDGVERFWVVWRWDRENYCCWVGDKWVVQQHKHEYGDIPIERCVPFNSKKKDPTEPKYFLDSLLEIQAEFNHILQGKSLYVDRYGKPLLWGRGIFGQDWESVKAQTAQGEGGGAVGLTQGGEVGLLQPGDMKLQSEYLNELFEYAKNTTGFSNVTFGELVGANTSGDALDMYFQPTQQATRRQWTKYGNFFRRINARILRYYDQFGLSDETFSIDGFTFEQPVVAGYYSTQVIPPSGTPRNALEEKRFAMEAVNSGFLPRSQGYEDAGYEDSEAIVEQLKNERVDPALHPEILEQSQNAGLLGGPPGATPAAGGPGAPPAAK